MGTYSKLFLGKSNQGISLVKDGMVCWAVSLTFVKVVLELQWMAMLLSLCCTCEVSAP